MTAGSIWEEKAEIWERGLGETVVRRTVGHTGTGGASMKLDSGTDEKRKAGGDSACLAFF